ncbi:MAG TPA: SDR family oxidoreductase [Longimicrobiales bacterium]
MPRPLADQVVVITGASSGIGRCAARHLAARGARVVLTARRAAALDALAREIESDGGRARAIAGDVRREADLAAVADTAVETFGRIDTWVNNAGVYIYGSVTDLSLDDFRDVLATDLVGVINGTRQALRYMLPARAGVVIQVSSILGKRGAPFTGPYSAAKAGIDGFCDALRAELWGTGVHVATLYVPSVDTPIYQHARTRFPTKPKPVPPLHDPIETARRIAELAVRPQREAYIGVFRLLYLGLDLLAPGFTDWLLHHAAGVMRGRLPADGDNIDHPMPTVPPTVRGGWGGKRLKGIALEELALALPGETVLAAGLAGYAAGRWWGRRGWRRTAKRRV